MARRETDMSRFLEAAPQHVEVPVFDEVPETSSQRQNRISNALERAAATKGAINENRRENDRMVRNHRKAKTDLFLNMNDLMMGIGHIPADRNMLFPEERMGMTMPAGHQMLTEQFPTGHDNLIMEDLYKSHNFQQSSQLQQRQPQRQILNERQTTSKLNLSSTVGVENWSVKKYLGETRSGGTVPIWKIHNKKANNSLDKMFRVESVANRVVMLLNQSDNLNDPRVVGLISTYDKRDRLLKETRLLERSADGKQMKTERLRNLYAEISQLDYKLGI